MEKLATWVRGDTGGPVGERFLQEGYVVVVADDRHPTPMMASVAEVKGPTYVDPAVIELLGVQGWTRDAKTVPVNEAIARMLIYENGYHDFVMGPQGHAGRDDPLRDATLDALERTVAFIKKPQPQ